MQDLVKGQFEWHDTVNTNFHELDTKKVDNNNLVESTGYGVVTGLEVLAQEAPNMTVKVNSGIVYMPSGNRLEFAGNDSVAISPADAENPRVDIVYINTDGTVGYIAGVPFTTPIAPDTLEGAFLLAKINVAVGAASIVSGNITDARKVKTDIDNLKEEFDQYKTDYTTFKNSKNQINGLASLDSTGKIPSAQLPNLSLLDNGRYQAEFGLEDAVLSGCNINSNVVSLGHSDTTTSQVNKNSAFTFDNSAYGVGQRISSAILQSVDEFYSVEVYVGSINSSGCDLKVSLYDKTAGVSLGQKILSAVSIKQGSNIFTFNAPIINPKGHDVEIRIDSNGTATSSNYCNVQYRNSNSSGDSTYISTLNSWSTVAENTSYDLYFVLKGGTYTTTGTTTKTYAPTDIKKWGNVKVTAANLGANNSATVTVKSSSDAQLKAPVTLVNGDNYIDISNINSSTYASLKIVFTLNRNTVSDSSPTISDVSVTWEGKLFIGMNRLDGSYVGDDTDNRQITVGVTPKLVIIYGGTQSGNVAAIGFSSTIGLSTYDSTSMMVATTNDKIPFLNSNGFTVSHNTGGNYFALNKAGFSRNYIVYY